MGGDADAGGGGGGGSCHGGCDSRMRGGGDGVMLSSFQSSEVWIRDVRPCKNLGSRAAVSHVVSMLRGLPTGGATPKRAILCVP